MATSASRSGQVLGLPKPPTMRTLAATPAKPAPAPKFTPSVADSSYNAAVANLTRERADTIADIGTSGKRDNLQLQDAVRKLAEARSDALQGTKTNANRQGLFYSGILGKRLGEVNEDFDERLLDQQTGFRERQEDRQTSLSRLDDDYWSGVREAMQAAIERQLGRDLDAGLGMDAVAEPREDEPTPPGLGMPSASPGVPGFPFVQKTGPNAGLSYKIILKDGQRWKQYSDGRPPIPAPRGS